MRVNRTGSSRSRVTEPDRSTVAPTARNPNARRDRFGSRAALAEDLARDHQALDLARALVDLRDLRVAVVALERELLRIPVAAEDLDRLRGLAARHLRREQLRLRALE